MIVRLWRGWTRPADADAYQAFLAAEAAGGFLVGGRVEVLRRDDGDEVAFVTLVQFPDWDAVRTFAGPDPDRAVVPEGARRWLTRWDERVAHFEAVA